MKKLIKKFNDWSTKVVQPTNDFYGGLRLGFFQGSLIGLPIAIAIIIHLFTH